MVLPRPEMVLPSSGKITNTASASTAMTKTSVRIMLKGRRNFSRFFWRFSLLSLLQSLQMVISMRFMGTLRMKAMAAPRMKGARMPPRKVMAEMTTSSRHRPTNTASVKTMSRHIFFMFSLSKDIFQNAPFCIGFHLWFSIAYITERNK